MVTIINDFFSFLKGKIEQKNYLTSNVRWIIAGYILLFSIVAIHSLMKTLLFKYNIITTVDGNGSPKSWIAESSLLIFVLQVGILAPLLEEFAFRGVLLKKYNIVLISLVILLYLVGCVICSVGFYSITLKSTIIFITVLLLIYSLKNKIISPIIHFTTKYSLGLIYFSAICFALWHYNNFDFSQANTITFIFTMSRFFFCGLVFCWISNRKGLRASLMLHILNNSLPVVLAIYDYW